MTNSDVVMVKNEDLKNGWFYRQYSNGNSDVFNSETFMLIPFSKESADRLRKIFAEYKKD